MTNTTTLDKHQLRALATQTRSAIGPEGGLPEYLREALAAAAESFDLCADGKVGQEKVQSCVDRLNECWDRQLIEAWQAFDDAGERNEPEAWRETLIHLVRVLPDPQLAVLSDAIEIVLEHMLTAAVKDFEQMPVAGSC